LVGIDQAVDDLLLLLSVHLPLFKAKKKLERLEGTSMSPQVFQVFGVPVASG
jgi:hypothetical protein